MIPPNMICFFSRSLLLVLVLTFCCAKGLAAQKGTPINNYFRFQEGVYNSISEFQADQPGWGFNMIPPVEYWINADSNELHLAYKTPMADQLDQPSLDRVWGVCLFGVPYLRVQREESPTSIIFARLHVVGKLCYLYYEGIDLQTVSMKVYHPITGDVLSEHPVQNRVRVVRQKLLRTESGDLVDFTPAFFAEAIADDPQLLRTFQELKPKEAQDKLFKMLLIYNDRNPFYLSTH